MNEWEKSHDISLPEKEEFYSNLNMEDITDADDMHPKWLCKNFSIKNLCEYHDFYFKSDTLLLDDAFENVRKIYQLDPVKFLSAPGLA